MTTQLVNVPTPNDSGAPILTRVLKRQPGLGRLNRLTARVKKQLEAQGILLKRFNRDYVNGTATAMAKNGGLKVTVNIHGKTEEERVQIITITGEQITTKAE